MVLHIQGQLDFLGFYEIGSRVNFQGLSVFTENMETVTGLSIRCWSRNFAVTLRESLVHDHGQRRREGQEPPGVWQPESGVGISNTPRMSRR